MVDSIPRRRVPTTLLVIVILLLAGIAPMAGAAQTGTTLVPIGGGYSEETLQGFAEDVIEHSNSSRGSSSIIDLLVLPSTYGTSLEDREENIELAGERTQQVEDACNAVVAGSGFQSCEAELLMLFDRDQAEDPANSQPLLNYSLDGVFMLGGDQTIAMEVLADTIAEDRLADAFHRGVVFGGTSAGAAMQSQTMLAGYVDTGWPYNALERDQIVIWWGDNSGHERGLYFGSDEVLTDQHFYERGRLTRLLNAVAQSDEHFDGDSLLGVGVDYGTGVQIHNDETISGVFGASSALVIDGESGNPNFEWLGQNQTLSADRILTHVLAPGDAGCDITTRRPTLDGVSHRISLNRYSMGGVLQAPGRATLMLGGDLSVDWSGGVLDEFIAEAGGQSSGRIAIVTAGFEDDQSAQSKADEYVAELQGLGWQGAGRSIDVIHFDAQTTANDVLGMSMRRADVAGVIFVGGNQAFIGADLANGLGSLVSDILSRANLVLTDRAMTAVMGDWYVANPDPPDDTYQDESIAAFRSDYADVQPGLGIISGAAFEPVLTWDQRWGRLYGIAEQHQETLVYGISENTAIVLDGSSAQVLGERSVVGLDARQATYETGTNGAFTALNVVLHLYATGELIP